MSDDIYHELVLDHNRRPRNFRRIDRPSCSAEGDNPLCGDHVDVFVELDDGIVKDVSFEGHGCAISTASASLMTEAVKGRTLKEVEIMFDAFRRMVIEGEPGDGLGKLAALAGVNMYPARVKCAILVWHALKAALDGRNSASTE